MEVTNGVSTRWLKELIPENQGDVDMHTCERKNGCVPSQSTQVNIELLLLIK